MDHEDQIELLKQQNLQLLARVARLEEKVTKVTNELKRGVNSCIEYDGALTRQGEINHADIQNAFERIINLELKMFPNLANDIDKLHGIIGDGDANYKTQNLLDRRKP